MHCKCNHSKVDGYLHYTSSLTVLSSSSLLSSLSNHICTFIEMKTLPFICMFYIGKYSRVRVFEIMHVIFFPRYIVWRRWRHHLLEYMRDPSFLRFIYFYILVPFSEEKCLSSERHILNFTDFRLDFSSSVTSQNLTACCHCDNPPTL